MIVTAAVLASSHAASAIAIDLTVLATLLIYWTAERYARLLAARVEDAKRPRWAHVRTELLTGWEFVTVSALPLLVLILARLAGASLDSAILWALWGCTALLGLSGWHIGARGNLSVTERLSTALAAALFGVVLIGLKTMLH